MARLARRARQRLIFLSFLNGSNMVRKLEAGIIADGRTLSPDHVPDEVVSRKDASRQIARCLYPALHGSKPLHVWLHGPPGSGKSMIARVVLQSLAKQSGLGYTCVGCWRHQTFYSTLESLTDQLRILRAEQQRTNRRLQRLEQYLKDSPHVIVLDDIDHMPRKEREKTVRSLGGLGNVGLICISRSNRAFLEMEAQARVRLSPHVLCFAAYSRKELVQILKTRAEFSLAPGSWHTRTLRTIAEVAHGNATLAIQLLRQAAYSAESSQRNRIQKADVPNPGQYTNGGNNFRATAMLTPHHKAILNLIRCGGNLVSTDLLTTYIKHCRRQGMQPVARRTFTKYLGQLIGHGLIRSNVAGRGQAKTLQLAEACALPEPGRLYDYMGHWPVVHLDRTHQYGGA